MRPIVVLPATAGHATAQAAFQVLMQQRLDYDVMSTDDFVSASPLNRASMVVGLVRGVDIATVELVRSLRGIVVPAFLVVEELSEADEVTLLHSGAYDVVRATSSPRLIGARLRTMFHHIHEGGPRHTPYHFANVTVRPDRHEVRVDDKAIRVTRTEFRLLMLFAEQPDRVLTKGVLSELLGDSHRLAPHAVESHVSRLRTKIADAGGPRLIQSVRGVGYRLVPLSQSSDHASSAR